MDKRVDIPRIQQIVTRQARLWEAQQRARAQREEEPRPGGGPCITLSREPGAGARELGRRIADHLGWQSFDRALLERVAERGQIDPAAVKRVEEGPHDHVHESVFMALDREYPGHHGYLKLLAATATSLAARGNVVLVGRGIHYILPRAWGIRARLVAPLSWRIGRVARINDWTQERAQKWIEETDRNQLELVRNVFHRDLRDPHDYDLVLNTAEVGMELAEKTLVGILLARRSEMAPVDPVDHEPLVR
jgi:cytidylate kinase